MFVCSVFQNRLLGHLGAAHDSVDNAFSLNALTQLTVAVAPTAYYREFHTLAF
jgi:hypothetical protein